MEGGAKEFAADTAKDAVEEGDLKDTMVDVNWQNESGYRSY